MTEIQEYENKIEASVLWHFCVLQEHVNEVWHCHIIYSLSICSVGNKQIVLFIKMMVARTFRLVPQNVWIWVGSWCITLWFWSITLNFWGMSEKMRHWDIYLTLPVVDEPPQLLLSATFLAEETKRVSESLRLHLTLKWAVIDQQQQSKQCHCC